MRLSQTSIIAAALMVAFILFITVRGELPAYLAIFTGKASRNASPGPTGSSASLINSLFPGVNVVVTPGGGTGGGGTGSGGDGDVHLIDGLQASLWEWLSGFGGPGRGFGSSTNIFLNN